MKLNLLFILVLSFGIFAQGEKEVRKTFYPNGKVETEGEYLDGKLDGYYREYYPTGVLWKEWTFKNGTEEGRSNWFFENGTLSRTWNYENGNREGEGLTYYETGELWGRENYLTTKKRGLQQLIINQENFRVSGTTIWES
jgi:Uncharacterized protein conserved in bacteria